MLQMIPIAGYAATLVAFLAILSGKRSRTAAALAAVAAALIFGVISAITLVQDGLIMFWTNHTANWAGNQVWLDLLAAVTVAFYLIAPRARHVGMNLPLWGLAVVLTASVALLPMLARLIWLERAKGGTDG